MNMQYLTDQECLEILDRQEVAQLLNNTNYRNNYLHLNNSDKFVETQRQINGFTDFII